MSAASDLVWGSGFPITGGDVPVKNTSGSALTAGQLVKLDTSNPISASQPFMGIVLTSAVADFPFGFLVENIPIAGTGRCRIEGIAVGIAVGAITVGTIVGASAATSGDVVAYTATDPSVGQICNTTTAAADPALVRMAVSRNA